MPDPRFLFVEPLFQKSLPNSSTSCGGKFPTLFSLIVVFGGFGSLALFLTLVPGHPLAAQESTIAMGASNRAVGTGISQQPRSHHHHFKPLARAVQRFERFPTTFPGFQSLHTTASAHPYEPEPLSVSVKPNARAKRGTRSRMAMHGMQWEGQDNETWLVGTTNASDLQVNNPRNDTPVTRLWNQHLVKRVLALGIRAAHIRLLNVTLAYLGRSLVYLKDQILSKIKKYGVAGFISYLVEDVLFFGLILIPASGYMYHTTTGAWLPSLSNPQSLADFGKLLGGAYLFSIACPPIEAARWALTLAMIPWIQKRLPPALRDFNITWPASVDADRGSDDVGVQRKPG
eukprot:gnl/TRDRNA2_/TRDRNA2_204016_c0_seq1.p1 gnl/TRDRNA2_/TRDRNA2_204016_c0~~gnl/TRDRNA2_/TRDRNA2_204016_c0_seq1.p1  ORF type:complete len:344 (+),score=22.12 gnl/TRDRNA2_/TRDRNA2_204016_c0_seq1:84-1115(+)